MSSAQSDDFQGHAPDYATPEAELEVGPRAERPNFLTATRFVDFDLPGEILAGLDNAGFEYCTPIQAQAIPATLKGFDIAGQAQTGTGKTTAFLVPLLTRLLQNKPLAPEVPRALIVTPTRELALQIYEDAQVLTSATELRQALVIGGMEYKGQTDVLATFPELVIGTPGRIIDYLEQGVLKTAGIEAVVIDEADRLLDMGFIKDLKTIFRKLPSYDKRQTMLFSATLDDRVLELTYHYMNPPQYITAEPDKVTKVSIEQELYHIGRDEKLSLLLGLLRREDHRRIIIFANTKSGVEWLAKKLTNNGFQAEGITGDLAQPKRLKLMESFKENRLQILVATDVASRGLHVDDISHVYNYDLPQDAENYVHRIGRTARAGHTGKAISFGCEDYVFHLEAIENLLGEKLAVFWPSQDLFQKDEGGDVAVRERRGGGDRKRGERRGGGREQGSRPPRGAARSQRPGGIFGFSPLSTSQEEDVRQVLSWTLASFGIDDGSAAPEGAAEASSEAVPGGEREGRRRKRRRGRRRDEAERGARVEGGVVTTASKEAESVATSESASASGELKLTETGDEQKATGRGAKSTRSSRGRKPKSAEGKETPQTAEAGEVPKRTPRGRKPKAAESEAPQTVAEAGEAPKRTPRGRKPKAAESEAPQTVAEAGEAPKRTPRGRKPKAAESEAPQTVAEAGEAPKRTARSRKPKAAEGEAPQTVAEAGEAPKRTPRGRKPKAAESEAPQIVAEAGEAPKRPARGRKPKAAEGETPQRVEAGEAPKRPARGRKPKAAEGETPQKVEAGEAPKRPARGRKPKATEGGEVTSNVAKARGRRAGGVSAKNTTDNKKAKAGSSGGDEPSN